MLQAAAHAVKCLAVGSVVLVGILPIYVAVALGMIVFSAPAGGDAADDRPWAWRCRSWRGSGA